MEATNELIKRGFSCACRPSLLDGSFLDKVRHKGGLSWHRCMRIRLFLQIVRFTLSARPTKLSRVKSANHLSFLDYYMKHLLLRDYDVVFMEQAFVQTLWSIMVRATQVDCGVMNKLIDELYYDYRGVLLFAVIDIDPGTAARRARARGFAGSRFDHMSFDEAKGLITAHESQLRFLLARAARVSKSPVFKLDGLRAPKDNAADLADFIERRLRAGPMHPGRPPLANEPATNSRDCTAV
jgi:hypothetical protein